MQAQKHPQNNQYEQLMAALTDIVKPFLLFVNLLLISLLLVACSETPPPAHKIKAGDLLPALAVQDLQEKPTVIPTDTGKLLIINVWATWCGACRYELPSLDRLQEKLGPDNVTVLGISVDDDSHVLREYLIEHKIRFPSYWDPQRRITDDLFGVQVYPSTFIVAGDGRLRKIVTGWREWDTAKMVNEINGLK
jgi:thiol-disulfide isomerase/thioredoxin